MTIKRTISLAFLPLLLVSFLNAQSVSDLAKKEKERRAAIKNKPAVATNSDLGKLKKTAAVEVVERKGAVAAATQAGAQAGKPTEAVRPAQAAGTEPKPAEQAAPVDQKTLADKEYNARLADLTAKAGQAQEMIDLLTLKMNALWQQFYDTSDVKSREYLSFQISETYDKLTRAEADATRAKKELDDFMAATKKEGTPSIWIK